MLRTIAVLVLSIALARADINDQVLAAIADMPVGGGYAISARAAEGLRSAVRFDEAGLEIVPSRAQPSFCSGATYLVFLKVLWKLQVSGLALDEKVMSALMVDRLMADGEGVWGHWNANGPGTARLFYDLDLGRNFTDFKEAKPGDFLKIWWTWEIGAKEHGHSVIYLGQRANGDVSFWSSNIPDGYGFKTVPRSKIKRALFSRLERPHNISWAPFLGTNDFLSGLLTKSATWDDVRKECGF